MARIAPGTRPWGIAVWLLLAATAAAIIAGLATTNKTIDVVSIPLAAIALGAGHLDARARRRDNPQT